MDELEIRRIEASIFDWLFEEMYEEDDRGRAYVASYAKGVHEMANELINELDKKGGKDAEIEHHGE